MNSLLSKKTRIAVFFMALAMPFLLMGCTSADITHEESQVSVGLFVFEEAEHDFGVIKQSGGIVQYDFIFTYEGDDPIKVLSTPGSCACTTAEISAEDFKKGDTGTLTVFFHPNLHAEPLGRFSKTVSLFTEPALDPIPEVTVWQEIDLDLGEEFFEMSQMGSKDPENAGMFVEETVETVLTADHAHSPTDHGKQDEIGHDGAVPSLDGSSKVREFTLTAKEINSELDDGMNYLYWTYDGVVPGPFLRAREGDRIKINFKNPETNHMPHSIDLHAVNGPGGGAVDISPGQEKSFEFTALNPGVYIYHCGTQAVAEHIANGAYGLIVIEPKEGFDKVDKEFYVVQSEFYPVLDRGEKGSTQLSGKKLRQEQPEFILMNGRVGSLTGDRALKANVGDKIRLFVGNAGVSKVSSFHVIGEIFDTVYPEGGTPVQHNIQTTLIPAGGATIVEFTVDVPGTYKLVDHALARLTKGAVAELVVTGETDESIFKQF
jgi:nitrite reductase (NO-forming)